MMERIKCNLWRWIAGVPLVCVARNALLADQPPAEIVALVTRMAAENRNWAIPGFREHWPTSDFAWHTYDCPDSETKRMARNQPQNGAGIQLGRSFSGYAPASREIQADKLERILQIPRVGGLHHCYERRAAYSFLLFGFLGQCSPVDCRVVLLDPGGVSIQRPRVNPEHTHRLGSVSRFC
jgi:hypothetical protein